MTYSSTYDMVNNVNIISVKGIAPVITLIPFIKQVFTDKDINHSNLILFDIRHFTIDNSLVELVEYFDKDRDHTKYRHLSIAFLYNKQEDIFHFIETAGLNRGWTVGSFNNLDDGIEWLKN